MKGLLACPFCREMFPRGEADVCPACGLALADARNLPPSEEALAAAGEVIVEDPPDLRPLPWWYAGRGRAALAALAALGLGAFFAPWVRMTSPETAVLSGADLARRIVWVWAAGAAWFTLFPLVVTRRSVDKMRGARVAAAFLSVIPLATAAILLARPPRSRIPIRFDWDWGFGATACLAVVATVLAVRFGGRPTPPGGTRDRTG